MVCKNGKEDKGKEEKPEPKIPNFYFPNPKATFLPKLKKPQAKNSKEGEAKKGPEAKAGCKEGTKEAMTRSCSHKLGSTVVQKAGGPEK